MLSTCNSQNHICLGEIPKTSVEIKPIIEYVEKFEFKSLSFSYTQDHLSIPMMMLNKCNTLLLILSEIRLVTCLLKLFKILIP